jgi:hypothetical protein
MSTREVALRRVAELYDRYRNAKGTTSYLEHDVTVGGNWATTFPVLKKTEKITRADVLGALNTSDSHSFRLTYLMAMAWGYGDAGYGPYRAQVIEMNSGYIGQYIKQLHEAATAGWNSGYGFLLDNPITDLGPAFATKLLYFCSPKKDRAPILDSVISKWLWRYDIANDTDYVNSTRFKIEQYELYVNFIDEVLQKLRANHSGDENLLDRGFIEYLMFIDQVHHRSTFDLPDWIK